MPCDNKPNLNISRLVIGRVHTDMNTTINIKMSHIMVSFSAHYISTLIDRVPHKDKDFHFHVIIIISFQISLLSPYMQKLLFQLKNLKINHSTTSDSLEYTKSCTEKIMLHPFLKTAHYTRILKYLDVNRDQELYRKISEKTEFKPMIKNLQVTLKGT